MGRADYLFADGDLEAALRSHQCTLSAKIDAISRDQFMNAQPEEIVEHVFSSMHVEPLVIYEDRAEMDQCETMIDVSGWRERNPFGDRGPIHVPGFTVSVSVPFTGDASLWKLKPNQWQSVFPRAKVVGSREESAGHVQIDMAQPSDEPPERFKTRLDEELKTIRFYIQSQKQQIDIFNTGLLAQVSDGVRARRERIHKHDGLQSIMGIPMKRKGGAPTFSPVKIARTLVRPLPPSPKSGFKPEPGISDEDYSHILSVIRHEGRTFETTPKTYAVHDEEQLRDILLAHLNGHYQGDATGEAFRRNGKTDIRIEDTTRAAFVAECKVWKGPKALTEAIDQLLGYLTWRDCKAAVVVFNKHNAKFNAIIESVPGVFEAHPRFKRLRPAVGAGEWQFDMVSREDDGRQVRVHVFVFNLFAA